jgi:sugar lactone lactonase YvrE
MTGSAILLGTLGAALAAGGIAGTALVLTSSGPLKDASPAATEATPQTKLIVNVRVSTLGGGPLPNGIRPQSLAVGPDGDIFIADYYGKKVYRLGPSGALSLLAGSGQAGSADGQGSAAEFSGPTGIAADKEGNVFVAEDVAHRIRKIDQTGRVTTIAGGGPEGLGAGEFRDGSGTDARFNLPVAIAVDNTGNVIVVDKDNNRIRRIAPNGAVTTLAGTGETGAADGPVAKATFSAPSAVAIGSEGVIYVAEHGNNDIRKITPGGVVTTIVKAVPSTYTGGSSLGNLGGLSYPTGLVVLDDGTLLVSDTQAHRVVAVAPDGTLHAMAGTGQIGAADGVGSAAQFSNPLGLALLSAGQLAVADLGNGRVRLVEFERR